jgi:hypothetical protein
MSHPTTHRSSLGLARIAAAALALSASANAWAQAPAGDQPPAPPPPPPGFEQQQQPTGQPPPPQQPPPPPGYYPPPGYALPPGYGMPPGAMLGPKEMDYEEGDPIPPGYHQETKIRKGLLIGGAVTFGTLYLISALTAASVNDIDTNDELTPLYIPAVGPFVTVGTANSEGAGTFLLVVDGVAQSGGLLMAILGIALQQDLLVRNDVGSGRRGADVGANQPSVQVMPMMVGKGTMGLGLVGSM